MLIRFETLYGSRSYYNWVKHLWIECQIGGVLTGPNGKSVNWVTAWIVLKAENFPRFITAYPGK